MKSNFVFIDVKEGRRKREGREKEKKRNQ